MSPAESKEFVLGTESRVDEIQKLVAEGKPFLAPKRVGDAQIEVASVTGRVQIVQQVAESIQFC